MFVTYVDLLWRCELRLVICVDKVPFGLLIGANRLFAALLGRETECVVVHESLIQLTGERRFQLYSIQVSLSSSGCESLLIAPTAANKTKHQIKQQQPVDKSCAVVSNSSGWCVYNKRREQEGNQISRVGIILEIVKVAEATAVCRHCLKTRQTHRGLQICACLRLQPGNLCRQFG